MRSAPTCPRPDQGPIPTRSLAYGNLGRAVVALPDNMAKDGLPSERIVFFDCPRHDNVGAYLQNLLGEVWNVNTTGWCDKGLIYNLQSAKELQDQGHSEDIDARLFEVGYGGSEGPIYAALNAVDLLVHPQLKARLQTALTARQPVAIGSEDVQRDGLKISWTQPRTTFVEEPSSAAQFQRAWAEGYLSLPYKSCSMGQAYQAYLHWCQLTGEKYPVKQIQFFPKMQRAVMAWGIYLDSRVVRIKEESHHSTVRMLLIGEPLLADEETESSWATAAISHFEQHLREYRKQLHTDTGNYSPVAQTGIQLANDKGNRPFHICHLVGPQGSGKTLWAWQQIKQLAMQGTKARKLDVGDFERIYAGNPSCVADQFGPIDLLYLETNRQPAEEGQCIAHYLEGDSVEHFPNADGDALIKAKTIAASAH